MVRQRLINAGSAAVMVIKVCATCERREKPQYSSDDL
jgi:hypothetical protein